MASSSSDRSHRSPLRSPARFSPRSPACSPARSPARSPDQRKLRPVRHLDDSKSTLLRPRDGDSDSDVEVSNPPRGFGYFKDGDYFDYVEHVHNYLVAAYVEVTKVAKDYVSIWVKDVPASDNVDRILNVFRAALPVGKKLEISVATAVIPISASDLANKMMSAIEWSTLLFPMVYSALPLPRDIIQTRDLKNIDASIDGVIRINAEFVLPTPFVPLRSFEFLRYKKRILEDGFIVVDISTQYFGHETSPSNSLRRPSGVLIREQGPKSCEIIVVENVVVNGPRHNVYSRLLNTPNSVFSANHWVNVVLWKCMRDKSVFIPSQHIKDPGDDDALLAVTRAMKSSFMENVCCKQANHDIIPLAIGGNETIILRSKTAKSSFHDYVGVKYSEVKTSPLAISELLVKKDLQLKLPGDPKLMFQFVSEDKSNTISLYNSEVSGTKLYCLQEVSRGEFCSFVLSILVSDEKQIFSQDILKRHEMMTTGFAIFPAGEGGLSCPSSIVTILRPFLEKDGALTALEKELYQIQNVEDKVEATDMEE